MSVKKAITQARGRGKNPNAALIKELTNLLDDLDEAGLGFLIEQARVHLHNMEVIRAEQEAARYVSDDLKKGTGASLRAKPTKKPRSAEQLRIERSSDGSSFHIVHAGKWKMFAAEEMAAMLKIVAVDDPVEEVASRLHKWLARERSDALSDLGIAGPSASLMRLLVDTMRKTFLPGGRRR